MFKKALLVAACALVLAASAQDIVGKWTGKLHGKAVAGDEAKPRKLILSKDRRQLSMKMGEGSGNVTLVLVRA